jgi:uncharacterized protein (DUF58 family)
MEWKFRFDPEILLNLLWPGSALLVALALACLSRLAHGYGYFESAVVLSVAALGSVVYACSRLIPILVNRLGVSAWPWFQNYRLTKRGGFFIALLLVIALSTSIASNNMLILVLSFLLASLLVSGVVSNVVLYDLKVGLSLPEAIHAKQTTMLFLTVRNLKKRFPSFALVVRGQSQVSAGRSEATLFSKDAHFPYLRAGESLTQKLACDFPKRGIYTVAGFEVQTRFPFGFFIRKRTIKADGKIIIYPALIPLDRLLTVHPFLRGRESQDRKGSGVALFNIRDYQRGDDARRIHWKSSGKLSRLLVREFVEDEDMWAHLGFSTYLPERNDGFVAQFEKGVSCVTSVARLYRRRRMPFTFDSGELKVSVDVQGANFEKLMDYLAGVQPAANMLLDFSASERWTVLFVAGNSARIGNVVEVDYLQL